ncbi:substrate-binding domain-containing protein [Tropicimonas sp. IMCC6043]|uniref:substrate-binding domain-containing protein n=1 Tax=Tropicimonas sp. IMCC6043 TaxID=2510645 RepID=UPI00101D4289|nr:substrate-binding domain-containing protein [Tropicimonas sp. IMCC6043]RYH06906.1 sulfate ABC transporter substrate-binding protein [Tropicimonas sp. IMCC6043]
MIRVVLAALVAAVVAGTALAETMKLAVTTSFENSGLAGVLLPEIAADLGIEVQLLVVGTGQAIRLGAAGDVDAILVHARAAEEDFVASGDGAHRTEIMYNDFVLIGPGDDPAGIAGAGTADAALTAIAASRAPFASRGDDSGTHKKELALWEAAGIGPEARDVGWYKETGSGMGATLNTAAGLGAYVMSDRASWLNFGNKGDLVLLFAGDPALFNQYAYLPVNPAKHPHVKAEAATAVEDWLISDRARALIDGYRLGGEQLFTFNAARE